ncbi:MAG TPA: hypothetical protein DCM68_01885 [Verrucomicrobia bacterium]|nr:hypothetical protein [Verrucomicrobiota bacterium]
MFLLRPRACITVVGAMSILKKKSGRTVFGWLALLAVLGCSFVYAQSVKTPVRVGLYQNIPKVAWSSSGRPVGIFVDLLEDIAAKENWAVEYVPGTWAEGLERLEKGEIDLMPDVAFSADRETLFSFHRESVLSDWFQIYARRGSGIRSLVDLDHKRVALLEDSIQQDFFDNMAAGFGLNITLVAMPDYPSAFAAVANGEVDAVVANRFYGAIQPRGSQLEDTAIIFNPTRLFFAAPKERSHTLLDAIDRRLAEMKRDRSSAYYLSLQRWTSEELAFAVPAWLKVAALAAGAILLLSLLGSALLKQQVTRRTRELKARNEDLHLFQALVEHSSDAIGIATPEGKSFYQNRAFQRLFGDIDGNAPETAYVDPAVGRQVFAAIQAGNSWQGEVKMFKKDKTILDILLRAYAIQSPEGRSLGLVGLHTDITSLKRAEEEKDRLQTQLAQVQKMESVGRLAGGVAHDFNNMLGAILGYTELLLEDTDLSHPHYAELKEIQKAAERSADLTRQLLAFARKQTVVYRVLDLNATVNGMLHMLRRLIGENIELAWRPGLELDSVKADPSQIDQILTNLCVNARDAIHGIGKITIETANASLTESFCASHPGARAGDFVMLSVSDTGEGMDQATLDKLFEPFFTTKALGQGTGLGLATVYGIVKQSNGYIDVSSEPGHGSTFRIYLPQEAEKSDAPVPRRANGPRTAGNETILLVEDEPAILSLGKTMLEKLGYRVLDAATPGEAIRLAKDHHDAIHLLLADVVMPEMNGHALAQRILALHPHLRCVFISGYTADIIARHGILDDGMNFIQKPFSMSALSAKVRQALDS